MKLKTNKHLVATIILVLLPLLIFLWIKLSGNFDAFFQWSQNNIVLFVVVLFLLKTAAFVYPPLPGGILTLGSIPILGWVNAYLVDAAGSAAGSTICFILGRKYGMNFLEKVLDTKTVAKIASLKVKKSREFESMLMFRILGGAVIEFVAYAGGILGFGYRNFILGSVLSHALIGLPTFYLAENIFTAQNIVLSVVLSLILFFVLYRFKGRYFE